MTTLTNETFEMDVCNDVYLSKIQNGNQMITLSVLLYY
jgi:hypothetical protein